MTTLRWLLPFTWGVNMAAIDSVVHLAQNGGASLVAVSLISVPEGPGGPGVRLEHIQQSKDFLEAVKHKSARLHVPVERYEVFTTDVLEHYVDLKREQANQVSLRPAPIKFALYYDV